MEAAKNLVLEELPPIVGAEMAWALAVDPWGRGSDGGGRGGGGGGIRDRDPVFGCAAHEVQHRGRTCGRAGVGGSDQRCAGGGEVGRGPGSGSAGDGAHVGAGDSGSGGAGRGPVGGGVPVVGSGGGCVVGDGPCAGLGIIGTASRGRRRSRCVVGGMTRRQCSNGSKKCHDRSGSWTTRRRWRGRGWRRDRVRSARRSACLRSAAETAAVERAIRGGSGVPADGDAVG